jgi:hypothetical protein
MCSLHHVAALHAAVACSSKMTTSLVRSASTVGAHLRQFGEYSSTDASGKCLGNVSNLRTDHS